MAAWTNPSPWSIVLQFVSHHITTVTTVCPLGGFSLALQFVAQRDGMESILGFNDFRVLDGLTMNVSGILTQHLSDVLMSDGLTMNVSDGLTKNLSDG